MPFDPNSAAPEVGFDPNSAELADDNQPATKPGGIPANSLIGKLYAAAHGLEDTASFGLADHAIAATTALLRGETYDESYKRLKGNAAAASEANPITATLGDIGGIFAGGGALSAGARAAEAIPVVGRGVAAANSALTLRRGQTLRNVGRVATGGAAAGGVASAAEGGDADQIGVSAAAGALAGPVVGYGMAKVAKVLAPVSDKAMRLLADTIGETPDTLQRLYTNFRQSTGRNPSMAEIVGLRSAGELRQVANDNPLIGEVVAQRQAATAAARPQQLGDRIEQITGPATDINTLTSARRERMDAAMAPIRDSAVPVTEADHALLTDRRVRAATNADPGLQTRIREAVENGTPLTVNDIDAIRKSLRGRQGAYANPQSSIHNPHTAESYGGLADDIAELAFAAEPGYEAALGQFERDSHHIRGFKHGLAGKDIGEAEAPELLRTLNTPEGQQGYAHGFGSRQINTARESEAGAERVAGALGEDAGVMAQAAEALNRGPNLPGMSQAERLQRAGQAIATGADRLRQISPGVPGATQGVGLSELGHAVAGATYHSPTAVMYHLSRLMPSLKMSEPVQRRVAQFLTDPATTQQGIRLLRRAGADNRQLHNLALAISGATGAQSGRAVTEGQ